MITIVDDFMNLIGSFISRQCSNMIFCWNGDANELKETVYVVEFCKKVILSLTVGYRGVILELNFLHIAWVGRIGCFELVADTQI